MDDQNTKVAEGNHDKKPVVYQTEVSNLNDPETRAFFVDLLRVCWRGMKFDEKTQKFVPDPNGR